MAIALPSLATIWATLPLTDRQALLADTPEHELEALWHDWHFWARPEQLPPEHEDWDVLLLLGGRGSGKTRPGAELIHEWAMNPGWYFALVGETAAEVRDVMIEGESGLLQTQKPWNPCLYEPSKRRVIWPKTRAWATTFSGDSPDQLRGPNCYGAWVDELCKYRYAQATWDNLEMVLRAGEHPRVVVSTTPRPLPLLKELMTAEGTVLRRYSTYDNAVNLAPSFINRILRRYEGTRLGRQELYAEVLDETEGALWHLATINANRRIAPRQWRQLYVGVDPPGGTVTECGIVAAGEALDGDLYTIEDASLAGSPDEWARAAIVLAQKLRATKLIAEGNHGGAMVRAVLATQARQLGVTIPIEIVHASTKKQARAEPLVLLGEQGRHHHIGTFAALEDEMTTWVPNTGAPSPNRLDALVWATWPMVPKDIPSQAGVW